MAAQLPSRPGEFDVEFTVGKNTRYVKNVEKETVKVDDLTQWIQDHTVFASSLSEEDVDTFSQWMALPKKQRDKIKVKAYYVTAGLMLRRHRLDENAKRVTLAVFDLDKNDLSPYEIEQIFDSYESRFFQTANSAVGDRRWRVIMPIYPTIPSEIYEERIKAFAKVKGLAVDACSGVISQPQMLPIGFSDYVPTVHETRGQLLDLGSFGVRNLMTVPLEDRKAKVDPFTGEIMEYDDDPDETLAIEGQLVSDDDPFGLFEELDAEKAPRKKGSSDEDFLKSYRPKLHNVTVEQIEDALLAHDPDAPYNEGWFKVGAALHHQFDGSDEGLEVFDRWSSRGSERYDPEAVEKQWEHYRKHPPRSPVTLSDLIGNVVRGQQKKDSRDTWLRKINAAMDLEQVTTSIPLAIAKDADLSSDERDLLAKALKQQIQRTFKAETGIAHSPSIKELRQAVDPRRFDPRVKKERPDRIAWLDPWVYVQNGDYFFNLHSSRSATRAGFNAEYDRLLLGPDGEVWTTAAQYALTGPLPVATVTDRMYLPGKPQLFTLNDKNFVNMWNPRSTPEPLDPLLWGPLEKKIARTLTKLLKIMFPVKRERRLLQAWASYVVQNPGLRSNWAVVMQGPPGVGKSMLGDVLRSAVGIENVKTIDAHLLGGQFNAWAEGSRVGIIEELRLQGERGSAHAIANSIKTYVTNDSVVIHRKGKDPVEAPNVTNYIAFTNHKDALPLEVDDRRYYVLFTAPQTRKDVLDIMKKHPTLFADLAWYCRECPESISALLHAVTPQQWTAEFEPKGHAPHTQYKVHMELDAMPDAEFLLRDALSQDAPGISATYGVISSTHVAEFIQQNGAHPPKTRRLSMLLKHEGYVPYARTKRGRLTVQGRQVAVWVREDKETAPVEAVQKVFDQTFTDQAVDIFSSTDDDLLG